MPRNICKMFGPNIKAKRISLKLTLSEVAKAVDSSKSYIWEVENGVVSVGLYTAIKISECLNTSLDEMITAPPEE